MKSRAGRPLYCIYVAYRELVAVYSHTNVAFLTDYCFDTIPEPKHRSLFVRLIQAFVEYQTVQERNVPSSCILSGHGCVVGMPRYLEGVLRTAEMAVAGISVR